MQQSSMFYITMHNINLINIYCQIPTFIYCVLNNILINQFICDLINIQSDHSNHIN